MEFRLNNVQRRVAIATAAIIAMVQAVGILQNGLEENRGWLWAFLAAGLLLLLGVATPAERPIQEDQAHRVGAAAKPSRAAPMPRDVMQRIGQHMNQALAIVNANASMANQVLNFIEVHRRYYTAGPLGFVLDPNIHAALAAHAVFVTALEEAHAKPEALVWETYRATIANRLTERRLKAVVETLPVTRRSAGPGADEELKKSVLDLVKGEMGIWEDVARRSIRGGPARHHGELLRHLAATFGGKSSEVDSELFRPLLTELLPHARQAIQIASQRAAT